MDNAQFAQLSAWITEAGLAERFVLPHRTDLYWCTKQA